ncbi:sciellin [Polyodon spathula]|uniref:sciellin n=1 Tax=Polyodon spathula TaxID=7913 RepID=UPI001B7EDF50|nr:sciellin [Polyodon spathula]
MDATVETVSVECGEIKLNRLVDSEIANLLRNETASAPGRSQVIQDTKKRTNLLQDNSWIKKSSNEDVAQSWTTSDGKSSTLVTKSVTSRTTPDGKTTTVTTQQNSSTKTWGSSLKDDPYGTRSTTTNKLETTEVKRLSTSQSGVQSTDKTADLKDPSSTTLKAIDGKPTILPPKPKANDVSSTKEKDNGTLLVSSSTKTTKTAVTNIASNQESIKDGTPLVSSSTKTTKTAVTNIASNQESIKDGKLVPVPTTKTVVLIDQSTAQQKSDKGELDIAKSGSSVQTPVSNTTITSPLDDLYSSLVPAAKTASYSINRKSEPRTEYSYEYTDGASTRKPSISSRRSESSYDIDFSPAENTKTTYKDNSSPRSKLYEDTVSTKTTKTLYSSSDSYGYESSPTVYTKTTYKENSSPQTNLYEDTVSSKSIKTVYSTSDRSVIEKDMCTYCRKPMSTDAKMILDEMQICCHASCFKCEVCNCSLGQLKAGDSLWIYRRTVHCENCFTNTREKWHR